MLLSFIVRHYLLLPHLSCCILTYMARYFQSSVGRPKHPRVMAGAVEGDLFIGRKAQELRGLLKVWAKSQHWQRSPDSRIVLQIKYPMEH